MILKSLVFFFSFSVVIFRDQSNNDQLNHESGKEETEGLLSPFPFILYPFCFILAPFSSHTPTGFAPLPVRCLPSVFSVFGSVFVITYQKGKPETRSPYVSGFWLLATSY